jgi:hypothetical protein
MDRPGQWPAKTLTAEQDRQDLARREADMEQHLSFSYALFDLGETELLGCVHIEPSVELEVGADISWWVIDWLIDSPIEQALDSSVQAWMVAEDRVVSIGSGRLGAAKCVSGVRPAVCGQRRRTATHWKQPHWLTSVRSHHYD